MPDSCTAHFHSPADIGKAVTCWGFAHNQRIGQGLELAMPWHVQQCGQVVAA